MIDPILYWNAVALDANRESHTNSAREQTGPTLSSRALGIIHLAMHDAWFGISGGFPSYTPGVAPPAAGASPDTAVAFAAYRTLLALFPSQSPTFAAKLGAAMLPVSGFSEGRIYGLAVADALLALRSADPNANDTGWAASPAAGRHRPDPDNPQGFHAPYYGAAKRGFAVQTIHQLQPPHALNSPKYNAAYLQVLGLGVKHGYFDTLPQVAGVTRRTPEQTVIGIYWGYDGARGLGTPPRLYNQIVLKIAAARGNTTAQNARLLALVNTSMADAGVWAWREKYRYDLWRPVVGIREHDGSMGPTGANDANFSNRCDPHWLPLGAPNSNAPANEKNVTPPFPAYPSGHATFGAAAFEVTRLFYAVTAAGADNLCKDPSTNKDLEFVSDELNGVTRDNQGAIRPRHSRIFTKGLWGAMEENGLSRVYLGVHWVFDAFDDPGFAVNIGGVPLGRSIAQDIFTSGLKPSPVL